MGKIKDLTGMKFGRLTAIYAVGTNNEKRMVWHCQCDCGNELDVTSHGLLSGNTKSCGCYNKDRIRETGHLKRKYNVYDLLGEYGIGYTRNGVEFYFDLEDYDKIKDYCWRLDLGYIRTNQKGGKPIFMHQLLCPCEKGFEPDHINRNKLDNRKNNLAPKTHCKNMQNVGLRKSCKSGFTGVFYNKLEKKWKSYITFNNKRTNLGTYSNKNEAIIARLKAEKKYYGDESPQRHLFKEYGIE